MGMNNNILRVLVILVFLLINLLVIFGISSLISYLNTGADRSKMLHTEIQKEDQYLPKVTWSALNNKGKKINEQTLLDIENNYLDAWFIKNVAFKSNLIYGIDDYFTESARENLYNQLAFNQEEKVSIEGTSLEHNLTVEFFSEDGQLVALTDSNVIEYKQVFKNEKLITEVHEVSTYQLILLLEDGFWRIRHMVRTHSQELKKAESLAEVNKVDSIKGINYYPRLSPWDTFNESFDSDTISADFKLIKEAGLNTVRVFVQYEDFGKAKVLPEKLAKLKKLLDLAEENELKVLVTLFDFYGDYSILDWTLNQTHAEKIVSALKEHNALLGWDIKNEPDLDFESRKKANVVPWLTNMIRFVKSIDSLHPVTIGWSNIESATELADEVDFVSFHYYLELEDLGNLYSKLKKEVATKSIVLTEFGTSSYSGLWNFYSNSEEDQAQFHKEFQTVLKQNRIPFMSWTLYDFNEVPKSVTGSLPWRRNPQKQYGFVDSTGIKKASFKFISSP